MNRDPQEQSTAGLARSLWGPLTIGLAVIVVLFIMLVLPHSRAQPKLPQLRVGMTVHHVEKVLGKPLAIIPVPGYHLAKRELREYRGDADAKINIWFDNGVVSIIQETKPRKNWPPVG